MAEWDVILAEYALSRRFFGGIAAGWRPERPLRKVKLWPKNNSLEPTESRRYRAIRLRLCRSHRAFFASLYSRSV
jgi:hypothetical protein